MRRDQTQFVSAATLISLALHALVIYGVMNLPIGMDDRASLFASARMRDVPVQVTRAADDLFIEDEATPSVLEKITSPQSQAQAVQEDAQKLLAELDPSQLAPPPADDPALAEAKPDMPAPHLKQPIAAEAPDPGAAQVLDASRRLLAMAQPSIKLPEYRAATDTVLAPSPAAGTVDPLAAIDAAQLDAILRGAPGAPGGTGSGMTRGAPGTPGSADAARAADLSPTIPTVPPPLTPMPQPAPGVTATPPAISAPKLPDPLPIVKLPEPVKPAVHLDDDFDYQLRVYREPPPKPGFFGLGTPDAPEIPWFEVRVTPRRSLHRLKPLSKDVVWVLDTSGSISKDWVAQEKQGVSMALESLEPGDRFNIVLFKEDVQVLSRTGPMPATQENFELARRFLKGAESSGYTDVNRALGQLITRGVAADRVYTIVLVSDGVPTRGAIDARAIINMITRENDLVAAIYCVGIGNEIDKKLLEFLAYRNKGYVVYPTSAHQTATAIRELAGRTRYPLLKDATFDAVGVDTGAIYPRIPRDIYQGDSFSLFGRLNPGADKLSMRITGTSGPQVLDFTFTLPFDQAKPGDEQTAQQWAFWKLHHLYSEIIRHGETADLKKQIDELRKKYKLKTAY